MLQLIAASTSLLPGHPAGVGRRLEAQLAACGILYYPDRSVAAFLPDGVILHTGEEIESNFNLVATGGAAPPWPKRPRLAPDAGGFLSVNCFLPSTSHAHGFAAGDLASLVHHPRPNSGAHSPRPPPPRAGNPPRGAGGGPVQPP